MLVGAQGAIVDYVRSVSEDSEKQLNGSKPSDYKHFISIIFNLTDRFQ